MTSIPQLTAQLAALEAESESLRLPAARERLHAAKSATAASLTEAQDLDAQTVLLSPYFKFLNATVRHDEAALSAAERAVVASLVARGLAVARSPPPAPAPRPSPKSRPK